MSDRLITCPHNRLVCAICKCGPCDHGFINNCSTIRDAIPKPAEGLTEQPTELQLGVKLNGMSGTGDADIDQFLEKCLATMAAKGKDYTIGSTDRLHNFRTVAAFTGQPMPGVWGVYFYKHVAALFSFIKTGGQSESEPVEGRIMDCVVYLLLFYKMVRELKAPCSQAQDPSNPHSP